MQLNPCSRSPGGGVWEAGYRSAGTGSEAVFMSRHEEERGGAPGTCEGRKCGFEGADVGAGPTSVLAPLATSLNLSLLF